MSAYLPPSANGWLNAPETHRLLAAFTQARQALRFVGGCVRDALLERPVLDIDAATPALPDAVTALLKNAGIKAIPTGIDHGTITAVIEKRHFEITTLRRDTACDGRHAEVEYTDDWREDASRRDFTMNALYATPEGEIIDYFNGVDDARAGRVRFIGDPEQRIREDHLRILRFFRFFAHYGRTSPDKTGLTACGKLASLLESLSGERIRTEMLKLLTASDAASVLAIMRSSGVTKFILPDRMELTRLEQMQTLEKNLSIAPDALRRLASLVTFQAKEDVRWLAERWKLSGTEQKRLQRLNLAQAGLQADETSMKRSLRRLGKEDYRDALLLEATRQQADLANLRTKLEFAKAWVIPEFPLRGQDLLDAGMTPGKKLGQTLAALEEYWEAQHYAPSRADLLLHLKARTAS